MSIWKHYSVVRGFIKNFACQVLWVNLELLNVKQESPDQFQFLEFCFFMRFAADDSNKQFLFCH